MKKVVVIGGGPAGIQTAMTAAGRGHQVILFEKSELGGQFNLSFLPPGKEMMKRPLTSFVKMVQKRAIDFRLNQEATVDKILAENPDLVIIATGAVPVMPEFDGLEEALTGEDVLTNKKEIGKSVLIIGGGMVGLECAEYLAKRDHEITVVELLKEIARDMEPITKKLTVSQLSSSNVKILTDTRVIRFDKGMTFIEIDGKEELLGKFDSVVLAVGTRSVNDLIKPLEKRGTEVKVIGDAKKPGQIYDAIRDGFEIAIGI
jgi:2,4-dienoyl-CoA reductase (NADPH2)